ncbi:MAG TPA: hypothetical protein VL362_01935 [Patescibacteria group bacterium]|jgi:hypothetical protein|nr:hypothetical protein [Patescibacteria group bacterium]
MSEHADIVRFPTAIDAHALPELPQYATVLPFQHPSSDVVKGSKPEPHIECAAQRCERKVILIPEPDTPADYELLEQARIIPLHLSDRVLGYIGSEAAHEAPTVASDRYRMVETPEAEPILYDVFAEAEPYEHVETLPDVLLFISHYVRNGVASGVEPESVRDNAIGLLYAAIDATNTTPLMRHASTDRLVHAATDDSHTLTRLGSARHRNTQT